MLHTYYDIKDENNLPDIGMVVDPYDLHKFRCSDYSSISEMSEAFNSRRLEIEQPILDKRQLREFIVSCLFESVKKHSEPKAELYFKERKALPGWENIIGFASTIAHEFMAKDTVSLKEREYRVTNFCSGCDFHRPSSSWGGVVRRIIDFATRVLSLQDLEQPEYLKGIGNCAACGGCDLALKHKFTMRSLVGGLEEKHIGNMLNLWGYLGFSKCFILKGAMEDPQLKDVLVTKIGNSTNVAKLALKDYESKRNV